MDNPTRRSDPVYDIKLCEKPLSPAPSSPAPAPVEMAQGLAEPGAVRAIFASRRDGATQPASTLYGADISGTLDKGETEFVLAVMRLATGAHPFAAIRMLTLAVIELRRHDIAGEPAGDDRKPWVEPTVTELPKPRLASQGLCETTLTERFDSPCHCSTYSGNLGPCAAFLAGENGSCCFCDHADICHIAMQERSATLTIAGVDLPNPPPPAPTIAPTAAEILNAVGWLRNRAGLQPVRTAEFESIARIMEGLGAEIVRQTAEISELQGMLEEAIGPVRFVSELAALSDTEVDFMGVGEIRATARGKIGEPYGFTLPRLYDYEDQMRAVDAMKEFTFCGYCNSSPVDSWRMALVDAVAQALGLQSVGQ